MATIKRTSPGPNIGTVGSGKRHPKEIGMKGRTGFDSTIGGQHSFMPAPKAKPGSKAGQTSSVRSDNFYDHMPKKPK